jgi:uncharacterized protein DUF4432
MPQITEGVEHGHRALYLENDVLKITVLPDKGADLYAIVHKPSGIDFLWKNPVGLAPPGSPPQEGSGDLEFLWNYEGAWQELFPNCGAAVDYRGKRIPFHGEVALLPWSDEILTQNDDEVSIRLSIATRQSTFRLERVMRLRQGEAILTLEETVTNTGSETAHFIWGHHCVLGEPFLQAGCTLHAPARVFETPSEPFEAAAVRLIPGQRGAWPMAKLLDGSGVDLSQIPGRDTHSNDDALLTDLTGGWVAVSNPQHKLTFRLDWDAKLFKYICAWQVYGGADAPPFNSLAYCLGIEPWMSDKPLDTAIEAGDAMALLPGTEVTTRLMVSVTMD